MTNWQMTMKSVGLLLCFCFLSMGGGKAAEQPETQNKGLTARLTFEDIGSNDQNGKAIALDYRGKDILNLSFVGCQFDQTSGTCTIRHLIVAPSDAVLELRPFPMKLFPGFTPKTYIGDAMVPVSSASQSLRMYSLFTRLSWAQCSINLFLPKDTVDEYSIEKTKPGQFLLTHRFTSRLVAPAQGALLNESIFDDYGYDDFLLDFSDEGAGTREVYRKRTRMYFPVDLSCCTRWPTLDGGTIQRKSEK